VTRRKKISISEGGEKIGRIIQADEAKGMESFKTLQFKSKEKEEHAMHKSIKTNEETG